MTDWHDDARALREQGLSYKAIGDRLGHSDTAVRSALDPVARKKHRETTRQWKRRNRERVNASSRAYKLRNKEAMRAYDRAYVDAHRIICPSCGGPAGSGRPSNSVSQCQACRHDEADRKARTVERLWNEGRTYPEIQSAMGWSEDMLNAMLSRYRDQGYDLPYRHRDKRHKFPHLERAA